MKAKTYRSSDFLGPQNLSSFGMKITPKLTLGLEEFNFIDILKDNKLVFIPASTNEFLYFTSVFCFCLSLFIQATFC
jgi:hypothetical protein